jgi:hypothetical protein
VVLHTNEFPGFGGKIWVTIVDAVQQYHPTGDADLSYKARVYLAKRGVPFEIQPTQGDTPVSLTVGEKTLTGFKDADYEAAVTAAGYPKSANPAEVNYIGAELILLVFIVYVTMCYGPIAAFLVELFPTRIRYTSMSFPYHIGNGWFGGFLPLIVASITAATGNIYAGFWYPISVALMTLIIGFLFIRETKDRDIRSETTGAEETVGDGRDPALV